MAEIPKLDMEREEKNMSVSENISININMKAYEYRAEKSDSYVIDMDAFSSGVTKDNANSRLTLQRSLSRKGSQPQRGSDWKVNGNSITLHDKDTVPTLSSPKGGCCTPEKAIVGSTTPEHSVHHHQISTSPGSTAATTESNSKSCNTIITSRRNSFRRSYFSWLLDPKRVLLLFATLSSFGTMWLIYFTLTTTNNQNE